MNKKEQFFEDKSILEGKLIKFMQLCQEVDRDVHEEIEETIINAFVECGIKADVNIFES